MESYFESITKPFKPKKKLIKSTELASRKKKLWKFKDTVLRDFEGFPSVWKKDKKKKWIRYQRDGKKQERKLICYKAINSSSLFDVALIWSLFLPLWYCHN